MPRPDARARLRIAWWGPSAPSESTSAWQSDVLLGELARDHDISRVGAPGDAPPDDVDVEVFNIEDDPRLAWVHAALVRRRGVAVLHDRSLLNLYAADPEIDLDAEVRANYGDLRDLDRRVRAACASDGDRLELPLLDRVCNAAYAVVVHDERAREDLSARHPLLPVYVAPLAIDHILARRSVRPRGRVTALILGGDDRFTLAERAARTAARAGIDVDLLRAGAGAPARTQVAMLKQVDVVVDLQWPASGGIRREIAEAVGARVPTVVASSPHAGASDAGVQRIPYATGDVVRELTTVFTGAARRSREGSLPAAPKWLASARTAAMHYERILRDTAERARDDQPPVVVLEADEHVGVNVVGDFDATTGLMEAGRRLLRSAVAAGADVMIQPIKSAAGVSRTRRSIESDRLPFGREHGIDLLLLNINEMSQLTDEWLRPPGTNRYVVGAWYWELAALPEELARQAQRVDEIWVASEFVRAAFRAVTRRPVVLVPPCVEVSLPPSFDPSPFGIRDDALVYFFNFDALSTDARKNPWGVIEAYRRAFADGEHEGRVQLALKVHNLERVPRLAEPLRAAVEQVGGTLIDAELSRDEMNGLVGRCDVYVSLHRSEGFGLGMAEAMYLGKPVVATAYSGNVDFTTPTTACLVGYSVRPVTQHDHRHFVEAAALYTPGLVWAEPDVGTAARFLRVLADQPALRGRLGRAGARRIRERYSQACQQRAVVERLRALPRPAAAVDHNSLRSTDRRPADRVGKPR